MPTQLPIYGIDRGVYPELATMRRLRAVANIRVACLYLAPAPRHPDTTWMGQRDILASEGWGFIPTYLGEQRFLPKPKSLKPTDPDPRIPNPNLTEAKGEADARDSVELMRSCDSDGRSGFAKGSVVYLDVEDSDSPDRIPQYRDYILAWRQTVLDLGFYPGIYGHRAPVAFGQQHGMVPWLIQLDAGNNHPRKPLDPGNLPRVDLDPRIIAHQFILECKFLGVTEPRQRDEFPPDFPRFDLSICAVADPSDLAAADEKLKILRPPTS